MEFIGFATDCSVDNILVMKLQIRLTLLLIPIQIGLYGQVSKYGLPITQNFTPKIYGAGIQNWDVAQDLEGVMYFSNNLGLLEYDGISWKLHSVKNATKVRSVLIDESGKIYVGCQGDFGYFIRDDNGALNYTSLADSLPDRVRNFDEAWHVYKNQEAIYFCTFDNIYKYVKDSLTVIEPQNALEMSFLIHGKLYTQEWNAGLMVLENDKFVKIRDSGFFDQEKIATIIPFGKDVLWIATQNGDIFLYDGLEFSIWENDASDTLHEALINSAIILRNGKIAIGTQSDGLLILSTDGKVLRHLNKERGLLSRTVLSLYQDIHDNLWAGLNNGISYIELSSPFSIINEQVLPGTGYTAFLDDSEFYLGTNNGLYYHNSNQPSKGFDILSNTAGQVYSLAKINNQLLIGHNQGTMSFDKTEPLEAYSKSTAGSWTFIKLKNRPNYILEGNYFGLALYKWNNGWQYQHQLEGFEESSRVMEQDDSGSIWMTHGYKGVYKLELSDDLKSVQSVRYYNSSDGFPTNLLINVFRIKNRLIFASQDGIYRYEENSDSFVRDEYFNKIFGQNNSIRMMKEDMFGNIYFISDIGAGVVRFNNLNEFSVETSLFNKTRGLLNDDLPNITVLDHQDIIYGAKEGFIHYNPLIQKDLSQSFHAVLRKVEVNSLQNASTRSDQYITSSLIGNQSYSYEQNSIRFTYSASFYEDPDYLQFQYFLEGFDENWSDWSNVSTKEYTNLREGEYTFRIRAKNIYGTESNTIEYAFEITPPWYRTTWAFIGYFSTAFVILFTSLSVQSRRHKKDKIQMSKKQELALNAKDTKIDDITRTAGEEITRLKHEKLQAEVDHKNKELATSAMLLINKNEFIAEIKNGLNAVMKKSSIADRTKELERIIKNIDKNKTQDNDWDHFEFHFDRVHGDFSERLKTEFPKLSPQERRLSAYLRMNLSSKEIANLLNISVRGVEISRYRLRKKLGIGREVNLAEFILNF